MAVTREQFAWIVSQRATFITPESIVANFPRAFPGLKIALSDVALAERDRLPPDWQTFYDSELEKFLDAPTARREVRVAELHRMYTAARDRGAACAGFLEQIAKEMADAYAPKGTPGKVAPGAAQDPIEEIRVTIIDPKQAAS